MLVLGLGLWYHGDIHRVSALPQLSSQNVQKMGASMNRGESRVAVLPATYRTAEKQIRRALQLLEYRPQRNKILLKPNLVTIPRWLPLGGIPRSAITDVRFIEALLRVLEGHEITIADGALATTDTDEVLEKISIRITNTMKDKVNRVVYDITNKPPSTIEWE